YSTKHTLYTGMSGQWACPTCECETPAGACEVSLNAYDHVSCNPDAAIQPFSGPICFQWNAGTAVAFKGGNFGSGSFACDPVEADPAPSNTPVPEGMRTYCCME